MTPMTPAERQSVAGPYRETFLAGLRPDVAAAIQQAAEFSESAMYETWGADPGDIPFDVLFTRAALVDLEAIAAHLSGLANEAGGEPQDQRFRDGLMEVLSLLERAQGRIAQTLEDLEEWLLTKCTGEADA